MVDIRRAAATSSGALVPLVLVLRSPVTVTDNTFQGDHTMMGFEWLRPAAFLGSILYAIIGVIIFWLAFVIVDKITPYDLWREIVEKQNQALGLVVAAMCLGISIIVAAAIH